MKETPVSPTCEEILKKREHVLIGISPFNSYFSEETIRKLIYWGHTKFKNFHLIVPDTLTHFNFLAIGYSESKALAKSRRQIKYLLNKINRAFSTLELDEISDNKVLTISQFSTNHIYDELHNSCLERYIKDGDFKQSCLDASRQVLGNYVDNVIGDAVLPVLDMSTKYLLGELPFYLDTPRMLGVNSSLFVYQKAVPFFVDLYKDRKKSLVADNQGHLILE